MAQTMRQSTHTVQGMKRDFATSHVGCGGAQALYPVPRLLRSVALPAPPPDARLFRHEAVQVKLAYAEALRGQGGVMSRLHLVMRLPKPGWGVLNVTGPVVAWSFAEEVPEVLMPSHTPNFSVYCALCSPSLACAGAATMAC